MHVASKYLLCGSGQLSLQIRMLMPLACVNAAYKHQVGLVRFASVTSSGDKLPFAGLAQ